MRYLGLLEIREEGIILRSVWKKNIRGQALSWKSVDEMEIRRADRRKKSGWIIGDGEGP